MSTDMDVDPPKPADPRVKILRIKTGVVKRLQREREVCAEELAKEQNRLKALKERETPASEVEHQEAIVRECEMMIPDTAERFTFAYNDLKNLIEETQGDLAETEELIAAKTLLDGIEY